MRAREHDFVADDLAVMPGGQAPVMAYDLLHREEPVSLLHKARQALACGGTLSVMHGL
jgi:hypothetical protein